MPENLVADKRGKFLHPSLCSVTYRGGGVGIFLVRRIGVNVDKEGITYRLIDNVIWQCLDAGCNDFEAAARNRKMVANKENIIGYFEVELAITKTPLMQALARWIPVGTLPILSYTERRKEAGLVVDDEQLRQELDGVLPRRGIIEEVEELSDENVL